MGGLSHFQQWFESEVADIDGRLHRHGRVLHEGGEVLVCTAIPSRGYPGVFTCAYLYGTAPKENEAHFRRCCKAPYGWGRDLRGTVCAPPKT